MKKLGMKTKDLSEEFVSQLIKLKPEILTEVERDGKIIKTINVDKLKELVGDFATDKDEVYELTWVGKQESKRKIAELKPLRLVFKDSSFKDDATKINCEQHLRNKLPETIVRVI